VARNQSSFPQVIGVHRSAVHDFSKRPQPSVILIAGLGVEGDAHSGVTVQHRSRVARDPSQPNLRQVHLIHSELLEELAGKGFPVSPGSMGENITTRGIDLLSLPRGTALQLGAEAVVEVTGLRNPCVQLDQFSPGLMGAVLDRAADGRLIRKAGVMGIVRTGGSVAPGDPIRVTLPSGAPQPLAPV
jgi:MOSC domain-containing protein YiiM